MDGSDGCTHSYCLVLMIIYPVDEVMDELHILEKDPVSGGWTGVGDIQLTQTKNRDAVMFDMREARPK